MNLGRPPGRTCLKPGRPQNAPNKTMCPYILHIACARTASPVVRQQGRRLRPAAWRASQSLPCPHQAFPCSPIIPQAVVVAHIETTETAALQCVLQRCGVHSAYVIASGTIGRLLRARTLQGVHAPRRQCLLAAIGTTNSQEGTGFALPS